MDNLVVEFDTTQADVEDAHRYFWSTGSLRWAGIVSSAMLLLAGALMVWLAVGMADLNMDDLALEMGLIAAVMIVLGCLIGLSRSFTAKISSRLMLINPQNRFYALGHRVLTAGPSGLSIAHPGGSQTITWDGVYRVDGNAKAIYIYTTPRTAIPIPAGAFGAPALFEDAHSAMAAWHAAARSSHQPASGPA